MTKYREEELDFPEYLRKSARKCEVFTTIIKIILVSLFILFALWFGIMGARSFARERPPAVVPDFPYDSNQVTSDILHYDTVEPNTLWVKMVGVELPVDTTDNLSTTHGTLSNRRAVLDPNGVKNVTYDLTVVAPSVEGVVYIQLYSAPPLINPDTRMILLNVEKAPSAIIYVWEPPLPEAIIYGWGDYQGMDMVTRQREFQKWVKATGARKVPVVR